MVNVLPPFLPLPEFIVLMYHVTWTVYFFQESTYIFWYIYIFFGRVSHFKQHSCKVLGFITTSLYITIFLLFSLCCMANCTFICCAETLLLPRLRFKKLHLLSRWDKGVLISLFSDCVLLKLQTNSAGVDWDYESWSEISNLQQCWSFACTCINE